MKRRLFLVALLFSALILAGCLHVVGMEKRTMAISGFVHDGDGLGIGGVEIVVEPGGVTMTSADGSWQYSAEKGAKVTAQKGNLVSTPTEAIVSRADQRINFRLSRAGQATYSVSGRVIAGDGSAIPQASVMFDDGVDPILMLTGSDGYFTKTGLMGSFTVTAKKEGYVVAGSYTVNETVTDLEFLAMPNPNIYSVSGRAQDLQRNPIRGAIIVVTLPDQTIITTTTDGAGAFFVDGISGSVSVEAHKVGYAFNGPFVVHGQEEAVNFAAEKTDEIYSVRGRVVDSDNQPVENVVILFTDGDDRVITAVSDGAGIFSQDNLLGSYTVKAIKGGWEFIPDSRTLNGQDLALDFFGVS